MTCSDIVALIALIVSIVVALFQFIPNCKNLKCRKFYFWKRVSDDSDTHHYCLTTILENYSRLPITLTSVQIIVNGKSYDFHNERYFLYGGSYPTLSDDTEKVKIFSDEIPLTIDFLSAKIVRILFNLDEDISTNTISIILETTRGTIKMKNVQICDEQY